MRIGIIGVGRVGSIIAYTMLFILGVKEIWLYDIDKEKLEGEFTDIGHASFIIPMYISEAKVFKADTMDAIKKNSDRIIICAGFPRDRGESDRELLSRNKDLADRIAMSIGPGHYIVTNPVDILAERCDMIPLGGLLDMIREKTDCKTGDYIIQKKGHTCFGIAAEAYVAMAKLLDVRKPYKKLMI